MDNASHFDDEVNKLERALRELAPAPARLDIAQTMYLAGQASARSRHSSVRSWQIATGALMAVSLTLGTLLAIPDQPQIVYVPRDAETITAPSSAQMAVDTSASADQHKAVESQANGDLPVGTDVQALATQPWLSPFSRPRSINMTLDELFYRAPTHRATGAAANGPALCSRDWPQLLEDLQETTRSNRSDAGSRNDQPESPNVQDL
jgi:hypothetical protein